VGALKSLEFYTKIGPTRIENRVKYLAQKLQNSLLEIGDGIEMLTPTEDKSRGAQIGFRIKNSKKDNPNIGFVNYARSKQMILRHVAENGLDNIRISTHYYNTEQEIEQCVSLLKEYAFG
jgi:selenocysteine lyase/cysteine desulfurase